MHNRVEAPNLPRSRVEDAKSRESGQIDGLLGRDITLKDHVVHTVAYGQLDV